MELSPGEMLGPYRLVERAGAGGMAEVWRAYQPALERYVAIKILPRHLASLPGYVERFRHEALAISRLDHPNILTVHDFGEQDGFTYMVTPYVAGGTLSQRLGRPWSITKALAVIEPLGSALDYAHARGIVHRDVKPSNVMLTEEGRVVLGDFGVARVLEGTTQLTGPGAIIGTPQYMAPEQVLGKPATGASDRYALGVVLYELLTGRAPYRAETPMAVALAHVHQPLPPPRSVNPRLSEAAQAVLFKALAKEPADRYPTGAALAAALRASETLTTTADTPATADERATVRAPTVEAGPRAASEPQQPLPTLAQQIPTPRSQAARPRWGLYSLGAVALAAVAILATRLAAPATPPPASRPTVAAAQPTAAPVGAVATPPTQPAPTAPVPAAATPPASPTADPVPTLIRQADSLLAQDLPGAVAKYQQAVSQDGARALAHRQLGIALFFLTQSHDDLPRLEQATSLDARDALAWAHLAASAYVNYQYDRVATAATQAAQLAPSGAETHAALALQRLATSDHAAARQEAGAGLTGNPTGPLTQWTDLLVSVMSGDLERALAGSRRLVQQQPRWASPHVLLGNVLRLQYDLDGARREYETALALDSRVLWAHEGLGWILLLQGRTGEATQAFQIALQRDARNGEAVAGLGYLAFLRQDFQTSLDTFKQAIDLNPRHSAAYAGMGWVQTYDLGAFPQAEASFRKALEIYPGYSSAQRGLGITQYRRGQYDTALVSFQAALALTPNDPDNSEWMGLTLMQLGRLAEARPHFERALALKPGDPTIQQELNELKRRGG